MPRASRRPPRAASPAPRPPLPAPRAANPLSGRASLASRSASPLSGRASLTSRAFNLSPRVAHHDGARFDPNHSGLSLLSACLSSLSQRRPPAPPRLRAPFACRSPLSASRESPLARRSTLLPPLFSLFACRSSLREPSPTSFIGTRDRLRGTRGRLRRTRGRLRGTRGRLRRTRGRLRRTRGRLRRTPKLRRAARDAPRGTPRAHSDDDSTISDTIGLPEAARWTRRSADLRRASLLRRGSSMFLSPDVAGSDGGQRALLGAGSK